MAIVLALLCAAVYGSADFCGGLASRRTATLGVVVGSQGVGFVLLLAVVGVFGSAALPSDWAWGAACGVAGAVAVGLLYRGLAIGTMSIVSPITAVLAAAVPLAYGVLARGERPSWLAVGGIGAALIAVVCVSAAPAPAGGSAGNMAARRRALPPGLVEALASGVGFGLFFIALAQTRPAAGLVPLLAARLTSLAVLSAAGVLAGHARDLRVTRPAFGLVLACGTLDMSANVLFVLAAHAGLLSVVAVISSLYPAATVALAAVVVGERLITVQWIGVAMALGGVVAISAAR